MLPHYDRRQAEDDPIRGTHDGDEAFDLIMLEDSAHECEGAKFLNREAHKSVDGPMHHALEQAQCIESDDPRLAK